MSEEQPKSYYAIIPANVRYDEELTPNAKLLYGEITALTNEKGYCWATNNYFANLYNVYPTTISKWLRTLKEKNYISIELIYKDGTKEIQNRYIKLKETPIADLNNTYCQKEQEGINKKSNTPINKKSKDNNTSSNNTFNNTYYINKELNDLFIDFLKIRKELKARNTERAIKSLLKTLSEYDDETKYKMIEKSIRCSWKDVFPLKENKPYKQKPVREEIVPEWFGKEQKENKASAEEQKEMEDLLREFDNP